MKYYLHDTSAFEDEKVSELFINYGYEGVGLFYVILEKLGKQEKPIKTTVLKSQLKIGKKLEKCWNFMESLGIISSNNGETFNKQLLNFSETYQIKSEKNAKRISEWREKQTDAKNVTCSESVRNAPKVKVSKVKVSKENNNTCETSSHTTLKNFFFEFYEKKNDVPFLNWNGRDAKALNELIKKMIKLHEEKKLDISPPAIENSIKVMLNQITDQWILDHISISLVNSKFSEIISNIKSSKNGQTSKNTNQSGVSEDYKRDVVNRILGIKVPD